MLQSGNTGHDKAFGAVRPYPFGVQIFNEACERPPDCIQ
jgi:hypothetical protein